MKKWIQNIFRPEGLNYNNPMSSSNNLLLFYKDLKMGTLSFKNGNWIFFYSEDFINQNKILPIVEFPDKNKEYIAPYLWPFFASRIPAINQPFHLKKIDKANIDSRDPFQMLLLFGKRTINNPYIIRNI
ncbi:HipA N-terminal domain-containing protein [bacterium]|nr:HipA N-terminal domain-containing protein [bacterium]